MSDTDPIVRMAKEFLNEVIEDFDMDADNTERTPERFVNLLRDMTTPEEVKLTVFPNKDPKVDEMVVVSYIPFYSLCAHHVVPFFGKAHVAYIPDKFMVGLSKIPRLVRATARGLSVQEVLTNTICEMLDDALTPVGVAVIMQAEHLCMTMRGVQVPGTLTTTSKMLGAFIDPKKQARQEFLALLNGRH